MITNTMTALDGLDDVELVTRSRAGDRDAFGELVARYQALVCSLAYSATGSLTQSEDLAQETFLAAWRQLGSLREPAKLRSWLCGIARNLANNAARKNSRQPVHRSASLDAIAERAAEEPLPGEQAVTREEEELLWRAVERIPETYREPLVLFYREWQSVESVARALDLTEDAARQRLSRGRKLLESELAAFVESTLSRTAPGRAFTIGVLAALPAFALSAKAATVGAAAAKGSATGVSAGILSYLGAALGPVIGMAGAYYGVKASLNSTRTPRERQFIIRQTKITLAAVIIFNVALFAFIFLGMGQMRQHPVATGLAGFLIVFGFAAFIVTLAVRSNEKFQKLRNEEVKTHPDSFSAAERVGSLREHRSKLSFLGLPLFHYRSGRLTGQPHEPAIGWIAIGDKACGILFAAGGMAVGGIAMGGLSLGVISFGGLSVGILSMAGLAIGGIAIGGGAVGMIAAGGVAMGYVGALGGLAIAQQFAVGGQTIAMHANDAAARAFFDRLRWMDIRRPEVRNLLNFFGWLPLALVILRSRKVKAQKNSSGQSS
jgi:RNA polymerase sigma factor (sigma-70 family)